MAEIDRTKIEQVTREVVSRYLAEKGPAAPLAPSSALPRPAGSPPGKARVLAVLMAARRNEEEVFAALRTVASRQTVTLVLTPSAAREFGANRVRQTVGAAQVVGPEGSAAADLVRTHDVLVFAALSMNGLAKLASFAVDSLPFMLSYYFLQTGKPIVVVRDGIWCTNFPEPSSGTPVGRRAEEMLNQLKTLGMRVTSARALASDVLWACGEPGLAAGGAGRTTTGTAGKVFRSEALTPPPSSSRGFEEGRRSGGPAAPPPAPAPAAKRDDAAEHTGTAACPHCQRVTTMDAPSLQALGAERLAVCHPSETGHKVAFLIDHTLLKPNATQEEIGKLCEEAKRFCFASVCVNPAYVPLAAQLLRGGGVKVCTVVGFPLGSTTPTVKAIEARDAIANGADEIDMVINVGAVKSGNYALALDDIRAVREATRGRVLKVIIETAYLTKDEKVKACELAKEAGADFVKTSTGFGPGGATVEDIALMRSVVGSSMGVKASGGIRDQETALKMVEAGATRIGASASIAITTGKKPDGGKY